MKMGLPIGLKIILSWIKENKRKNLPFFVYMSSLSYKTMPIRITACQYSPLNCHNYIFMILQEKVINENE